MAVNDSTLIAEVRAITGYESDIISTSKFQELAEIAKREIQANKGTSTIDFYGEMQAERTLFWLTCIFAKMKSGEIDGAEFSISELKVESSNSGSSVYFDNFWRSYHSIGDGRPRGHLKGQRSNRTYDYDNTATEL